VIGEVLTGVNNIYTVRPLETPRPLDTALPPDGAAEAHAAAPAQSRLCRIRGKTLRADGGRGGAHNPIAVGDLVVVEPDPHSPHQGWITGREPRRSAVLRYNKKSRAPQALAANVDLLVCVTSTRQPPFRPRFVDRVLVSGHAGGAPPAVVVNKCDLGIEAGTQARLEDYARIGYTVIRCSAVTGQGLDELRGLLAGRTSVLVGQSGVGKSSLLNALDPSLGARVGDVSFKHDRGSHTTSAGALLTLAWGARVIDTPGIRELDVHDMPPAELRHFYPEFEEPGRSCAFASCTHTGERGCAVERAVGEGRIHSDRYESYVRTFADLVELERSRYG
jgi:ribosome biogenesis GTPase